MRLIEIPEDGIVSIPIMRGDDTVGERRIDLSFLPTVDAVEVVHGRWDIDKSFMPFISTCSECGAIYDIDGAFEWHYCPNCGAKMDGGN